MIVRKFYNATAFPESALLEKRVFKKLIRENVQLGTADEKALKEDVSTITWQYALKPNNARILPFEDETREYLEVAVLEVALRSRKREDRIANVLHRAIPYPVILILVENDALLVSVAHKRFSQAEKGAIVAEKPVNTNWLVEPLAESDELFLTSLRHADLSHQNFFAYYEDFARRVLAHKCAELSGSFKLQDDTDEERRAALEELEELRREVTRLKGQVKKATQFAEKVELNIAIKELEGRLADATAKL